MPKKAIDYSKTIIYKIVPKDLNLNFIYVGSTTDFRKRKTSHKGECNNNNLLKIYKTIRENGGWDAFEMLEIEKYVCNDGNEARTRERYWMELLNANLNTFKPITTIEEKKEYDKTDKRKEYKKTYAKTDKRKEYLKEYYKQNADKILQHQKEYNLKKKLEKENNV